MILDELRVRDFCTPMTDFPHISISASVHEAITIMRDCFSKGYKHRTILVIDEVSRLKGYLSLANLIHAIGPDFLRHRKSVYRVNQSFQGISDDFTALSFIWQDGLEHKLQEAVKRPVVDVMTLVEKTVRNDDSFAKCVFLMLIQDVIILPVIEDTKMTGVVRLVDVFEQIASHIDSQKNLRRIE